jgi:putative membrane protein
MRWHDGMGAGGWLAMSLMMLIVLAVVVAGFMLVARSRNDQDPPNVSQADAILEGRLARGEINAAEYREARAQFGRPLTQRAYRRRWWVW